MFNIYVGSLIGSERPLKVYVAILESERLSYEIIEDRAKMMRLTNGRLHPVFGFVVTYGDEIVGSIYELTDLIRAKGLILC